MLRPNRAALEPGARRVAFPELVRKHDAWHKGLSDPTADDERRTRQEDDYHSALNAFEAEHGRIINAYWCSESAVALTAQPRRLRSDQLLFHRVSDRATKEDPDIRHVLQQCDELAIRAREVLGGSSERICVQLVMASACHLLSMLERAGTPLDEAQRQESIAIEQREVDAARNYYEDAANGEAQLVYFAGMALGIGFLVGVYLLLGNTVQIGGVSEPNIVGSLSAGAIGALVSVLARINSGSFALDYDVSRGYTLFLGSLRPGIGSIFGVTTDFAITSGFLDLFKVPTDPEARFYFLCVVAFLAGFSERWAQDTLTGGLGRRTGAAATKPPAAAATSAHPTHDAGADK